MDQAEQREYWRMKQRESRARRRAKKDGQPMPQVVVPPKPKPARPQFSPAPAYGINANVSCRASMEEIAALGPVRCAAFMNGVANVISVLNPRTPVGGQLIR